MGHGDMGTWGWMVSSATRAIWETMSRWEMFAKVPTPLNNCKLVHVPKKELRPLKPGQFRPIAILPAFWRAWSSTWMQSEMVRAWPTKLFPSNVTGGMPGAQVLEREGFSFFHSKRFIHPRAVHSFQTELGGVGSLSTEQSLAFLKFRNHCEKINERMGRGNLMILVVVRSPSMPIQACTCTACYCSKPFFEATAGRSSSLDWIRLKVLFQQGNHPCNFSWNFLLLPLLTLPQIFPIVTECFSRLHLR